MIESVRNIQNLMVDNQWDQHHNKYPTPSTTIREVEYSKIGILKDNIGCKEQSANVFWLEIGWEYVRL